MGKSNKRQGSTDDLGVAVRETLLSALETGRLVTGGLRSAHFLATDPLSVMVCVVPRRLDKAEEVTLSIQRTLIEAFCLEFELNQVEVDDDVKLGKTLRNKMNDLQSSSTEVDNCNLAQDFSCLLVLWGRCPPSQTEAQLIRYCKEVVRGQGPPDPLISLPD